MLVFPGVPGTIPQRYTGIPGLHPWQIGVLWQPYLEQDYHHGFSSRASSLPVSVSHFDSSRHISNIFMIIILVRVIFDCDLFEFIYF